MRLLRTYENYTETQLLAQIAQGDDDAFKHLYRLYIDDAYAVAIAFLHLPQAAEDIVQELFIKIWQQRTELTGVENFRAYMMVSLRNMLINELQKMKTRTHYEQQAVMQHMSTTPADEADAATLQRLVHEAILQLPSQQQNVYRLSREQGMDIKGIAAELQLAPKTVSNLLSMALHHLRSFLYERGYLVAVLVSLPAEWVSLF